MSYTIETLVNDTYERLALLGPVPPSLIPRLAILVPSALRSLADKMRAGMAQTEVELYRKDYTVDLTDGQGSLATHTDLTSEPMIPSDIVKVTHPDCVTEDNAQGKLRWVGSSAGLDLARSQEFAYYTVENNTLFTKFGEDRTALGNEATVRAGFVPAITSVRFSHEPLLLDCMVELARPMVQKAP